ncbi:MAG: T9SS type A sorting domain-containing protein, partial [Bacteroidales bacterium]|nr:T9SS type A sorting domain-containing protein [Bacteroidales bacterium]
SRELIGGSIVFCCTDAGVYYSQDYAVGVEKKPLQNKISLFPNPVKDEMKISIKSDKPINGISSVEIYNNHGQKVDEIKFESNSSNEFEIKWDKGNLPAGVYYIVIKTKKEYLSEKFIIL